MGDRVILSSTTASQEELNEALGLPADAPSAEEEAAQEQQSAEQEFEQVREQAEQARDSREKGGFRKRLAKLEARNASLRQTIEAEGGIAVEPEFGPYAPGRQAKIDFLTHTRRQLDDQLKQLRESNLTRLREFEAAHSRGSESPAEPVAQPTPIEQPAAPSEASLVAQQQENLKAFAQRLSQREDLDELRESSKNIILPTVGIRAVPHLENGPEVFAWLNRNPETAQQITERYQTQLAAVVQATGNPQTAENIAGAGVIEQLQRISIGLQFNPSQPARNGGNGTRLVSSAPSPIRPVGGSSTRSSLLPEEMSYADYKKFREAGAKERARKGYGI